MSPDQITVAIWALAVAVVGHMLTFWIKSPKDVRKEHVEEEKKFREVTNVEFRSVWSQINEIRLNGITKTDLRQVVTDLQNLHSVMLAGVNTQIQQLRELVHELRRAPPD